MLTLDLATLSGPELADAVVRQCAALGTVTSAVVHKPADQIGYAVALVSMSGDAEADRVLADIGDSRFGSMVIVRLEQAISTVPVSLKLLAAADAGTSMYDLSSCVSHLAAVSPAATAPVRRKPIEILLVEDDPADVRMTREALHAADIPNRLHVVVDGLEAVSFLCRTRQFNDAPQPDIVLLDLNIPKINGHEVLTEIKSNERLKHIPIVVLTNSKSASDMRNSYLMKADRFMTKAMGLDAHVEQMKSIAALAMD